MESTLNVQYKIFNFLRLWQVSRNKTRKRTKFLESQLVESLAALSKSEEKQDTKGFLQYNLFVLRFFLHYVKSKFVRVAHITNSIMISYNTMNKLLGKFIYECQ